MKESKLKVVLCSPYRKDAVLETEVTEQYDSSLNSMVVLFK